MTKSAALLMFTRFGLGPRSGDLAGTVGDPRDILEAEIHGKTAALVHGASLFGAREAIAKFRASMTEFKAEKAKLAGGSEKQIEIGMEASSPDQLHLAPGFHPRDQIIAVEAQARLNAALAGPVGFTERLVWFWSNHFAVSVAKSFTVRASAGAFEREAIRPHVFGRFADMLMAAELHPAMLAYLDNFHSIGSNSLAGRRRGRGLNENLAREALELHTLGVDGGYTQSDVTNFARILTGWTINGSGEAFGSANFNPNWHDPGTITLLGKTYAEGGAEQARQAMLDLARHPSTARHLATKLARHFVADDPPVALIDKLAGTYQETDGDLHAVSMALIRASESWNVDVGKIRAPVEFLVAAFRLLDTSHQDADLTKTRSFVIWSRLMGQPLWEPGGPNGFPDTVAAWGSAESIKLRLRIAVRFAERVQDDPDHLATAAFGPDVSNETRNTIARAASRAQGTALLLMAPEFQWR